MINLSELTPIMVSECVKHLEDKLIFSKKRNRWKSLSERTINVHIKKLRQALVIVDILGTEEIRDRLITIIRPEMKKEVYVPTNEELARVPEMLRMLKEGEIEESRYLAFIAATVLQFCGRTNALSVLRFNIAEGLEEGEKPIASYMGKHGVEQVKVITNEWHMHRRILNHGDRSDRLLIIAGTVLLGGSLFEEANLGLPRFSLS